jgi:hypothetical protein
MMEIDPLSKHSSVLFLEQQMMDRSGLGQGQGTGTCKQTFGLHKMLANS